jgi:hypothetical protein
MLFIIKSRFLQHASVDYKIYPCRENTQQVCLCYYSRILVAYNANNVNVFKNRLGKRIMRKSCPRNSGNLPLEFKGLCREIRPRRKRPGGKRRRGKRQRGKRPRGKRRRGKRPRGPAPSDGPSAAPTGKTAVEAPKPKRTNVVQVSSKNRMASSGSVTHVVEKLIKPKSDKRKTEPAPSTTSKSAGFQAEAGSSGVSSKRKKSGVATETTPGKDSCARPVKRCQAVDSGPPKPKHQRTTQDQSVSVSSHAASSSDGSMSARDLTKGADGVPINTPVFDRTMNDGGPVAHYRSRHRHQSE